MLWPKKLKDIYSLYHFLYQKFFPSLLAHQESVVLPSSTTFEFFPTNNEYQGHKVIHNIQKLCLLTI